ncbi:MAG: hypothetical protein ACU85V_02825 [Gammaproteobacteria bacterium]
MALSTSSLYRNLSRLELAIAVIVISILVVSFLQRMRAVELAAERATLDGQVQDMQARLLGLRADVLGGRISAGELSLSAIARRIGHPETVYVAAERGFDWNGLRPGGWVYFEEGAEFAYRPLAGKDMPGASGRPPRVRLRLRPLWSGTDDERRLRGAMLERLGGP